MVGIVVVFIFEGGFENIYGNKQLIAELQVEYTDGTWERFGSDETWLVKQIAFKKIPFMMEKSLTTYEKNVLTTEVIDGNTALLTPRLDCLLK